MDIDVANEYPADPATVFAMFKDADFLKNRSEALGHTDVVVAECRPVEDEFRIRIERRVLINVPKFARRVLSPRTSIEQADIWDLDTDSAGTRYGRWKVNVKGAPISMQGEIALAPSNIGTVHHITGTMNIAIPVIGGRLRKFLLEDTFDSIRGEYEQSLAYLEETSK
jgi:hypothetical protein